MKTKNKNKKQLVGILAIVLSTMAVGGFASANVSAAGLKDSLTVNPEFQRYLNDVANGNGSKWGLVPNQYLVNVSSDGKGSVNLPAAYSLKDLGTAPSLRDQGADGICWAYSTVSAAESTLKKTLGGNVQFSAKQLDYLMGNNTPYGQFMQSALGITHEIGAASNFYIASIGLSSAYAPAEENAFFAKMKANDASLELYNSLEQFNNVNRAYAPLAHAAYDKPMDRSDIMTKSNYVATGIKHYFGGDTDVIAKVKAHLYQYGAMYVGSFAPETEGCWDERTSTIIDRGMTICGSGNGHAMTVIGWDDSHTYTDPADGATKTGAFLIQNSWGKSSLYSDYDITADSMMEAAERLGMLEGKTTEQINAIRTSLAEYVSGYNAREYIYLGYNFASTIDFGGITQLSRNEWDNVYDGVTATSAGVEGGKIVYRWTLNEPKQIEGISFGTLLALNNSAPFSVTLDGGDGGATHVFYASAGESGRDYLEFDEPVYATSTVSMIIDSDRFAFADEDTNYLTPMVFANAIDEEIVVPDTSTTDTTDTTVTPAGAPNTGSFTGEKLGAIIGGVTLAFVLGISGSAILMGYRNRKALFDRVGFDKKK